ncbi:MAG: hypothetical protein M1834_005096 [Cirrosporium novae-zelandiae]|nr:MAG: hypothetical protein M1834_005096 [Cirrosporium novae-zelandiae]
MVSAPPTGGNVPNNLHGPSGARISLNPNGNSHLHSHNKPLSALRAAPLDMATVERRGQPLAVRETTKRVRPHGLQEAPTYRPTKEEFKEPFQYIRNIAPEASKYGICKIIPPDGWDPPFAIDTERFHFRTRKQELNSVEGGTRTSLNYVDQLQKFHKLTGTNLNRFPSVDKKPLDMYKLKKAVEVRGGFDAVCKLKKWAEIGRDLGYSGKIMSSLSTSLKNSYQKWLQPYEDYLRVAKPGVHQQLELENGGPYVRSPVNSPFRNSHPATPTPMSDRDDSPALRASAALNNVLKESEKIQEVKPTPPVETPRPLASSGFTAVNAPTTSFVAVNSPSQPTKEVENVNITPKLSAGSSSGPTSHLPDYRPSPLGPNPPNGHGPKTLKRAISREGSSSSLVENGIANGEGDGPNGRRSKRIKKEPAPTVAGSHMSLFRPSTPKVPLGDIGNRKKGSGERCESCGKSDDLAAIVPCDSCDNAYHRYCLEPPLITAPDYGWHCPRCLVGTGEFGFEEGGIYSLKSFQDKARDFKDHYFSPKMPFDPILNGKKPVSEDDVEREFWKLVESLTETVEVEYGADIHSTTHGSGFPTLELNPLDPYSYDPWNLNVLPFHNESLFRHIKSDISGMTVPWLYVGMCFSTFCWHNEDHYTYSANYQHFGATKTWYGIPGADADNFEEAMRQAVPELFETQPDLLFQLVTLLPPDQLKKAGVSVYALDQRAGQFVITFPQAYHAGFNHGFNFNEAVNFAPPEWEPWGEAGVKHLQEFRRSPCFSHDELLLTAASRDSSNIKTTKWLAPALERLKAREFDGRHGFVRRHKEAKSHAHCRLDDENGQYDPVCELGFKIDEQETSEIEYQCIFCKAYTYLSRFRCQKSGKVVCLLHAGIYDCCHDTEQQRLTNSQHSVHYRITDNALESMIQKIVDRAHQPEAWKERFDKLLEDDPTPPLKSLRALLSEGEKIPYPLEGLPQLKAFVERCNEWVEEATNYTVRKQQNRRKNEKAWRKGNSAKAAELEERDRELRKVENIEKLLKEAADISFDCPEIGVLKERAAAIADFIQKARAALAERHPYSTQDFEKLVEDGRAFNVDIPEVDHLDKVVQHMQWTDQAHDRRSCYQTLEDVTKFIEQGIRIGIPRDNEHMLYFEDQKTRGNMWEEKVNEIVQPEMVNYQQLEALSNQASTLPVSPETRAKVDAILAKQREAHKHIAQLCQRSKDLDFRKRPKYKEVRELMDSLQDFNSKPTGTIDLEKEQKRHEDWMRRGKKLFGKANAPLHILLMHMQYVDTRNKFCFDPLDRPRSPVEPPSREPTPENDDGDVDEEGLKSRRDVFCICRQPEFGMMIECELCHEWYHGKCLKIARGKVKDYDNYTCPICDWRVKIPRDAARPKLEDLIGWQDEIIDLPFQPDEEEVLKSIINVAQDFRDIVRPFCNPILSTADEVPTNLFWLRKIEGAEILLVDETNWFRQELHRWAPVAPDPPPKLEYSNSTRKPRPTKQQRMMAELGVERPEDLPPQYQTRHLNKRKSSESQPKQPPLQPAPQLKIESNPGTPRLLPHPISTGNPLHSGPLSAHGHQPSTSGYPYDSHFATASPHTSGPPSAFLSSHPSLGSPNSAQSPSMLPHGSLMFGSSAFQQSGGAGPSDSYLQSLDQEDSIREHRDAGSSQDNENLDQMFVDLTNQDESTQEQEMPEENHASEALDAMTGANVSVLDSSANDSAQDEMNEDSANGANHSPNESGVRSPRSSSLSDHKGNEESYEDAWPSRALS